MTSRVSIRSPGRAGGISTPLASSSTRSRWRSSTAPTPQTREAIVEYLLPEKKADAKKEADMKGGMTEAAKAPPTPNFAFDPKALDVKIRGALRLLLCSPEFQLA